MQSAFSQILTFKLLDRCKSLFKEIPVCSITFIFSPIAFISFLYLLCCSDLGVAGTKITTSSPLVLCQSFFFLCFLIALSFVFHSLGLLTTSHRNFLLYPEYCTFIIMILTCCVETSHGSVLLQFNRTCSISLVFSSLNIGSTFFHVTKKLLST